jgi:type II secretory pathway component GspD/PulD (secretin)
MARYRGAQPQVRDARTSGCTATRKPWQPESAEVHVARPTRFPVVSPFGLACLVTCLLLLLVVVSGGGFAQEAAPKPPEPRQLIVDPQPEVKTPPATAPTTAPAAGAQPTSTAPAPLAPPQIRVDAQGEPLVTNSFANTDIRDALAQVGQETGTTIVPDSSVSGTVTLELTDAPLHQALELVLLQGGFVLGEVGKGMYLVTSPDPSAPNFRRIAKTQIVKLDYLDCSDVRAMLPTFYSKFVRYEVGGSGDAGDSDQPSAGLYGIGTSAADRQSAGRVSNARVGTRVVVSAPPELLEEIITQIRELDQPPAQIMVEALVVEALASDLSEFHAEGSSRYVLGNSQTGLVTYTSVAQDLLARIQWLITNQKAETKANPSIVAQEGRSARVEVAKQQYFSILSGSVAYPYTTIQQIDAAISLDIMPRIADKTGEITMRLRPAVADVTGQGLNQLPIITKRSADTTVRVKDGQVIAIGGLLETVKIVERRKIPILGDIPLIGQLFRSSDTTSSTREVIIFIVPHKLGPDGSLTGSRLLDLPVDIGRVLLPKAGAEAPKP